MPTICPQTAMNPLTEKDNPRDRLRFLIVIGRSRAALSRRIVGLPQLF